MESLFVCKAAKERIARLGMFAEQRSDGDWWLDASSVGHLSRKSKSLQHCLPTDHQPELLVYICRPTSEQLTPISEIRALDPIARKASSQPDITEYHWRRLESPEMRQPESLEQPRYSRPHGEPGLLRGNTCHFYDFPSSSPRPKFSALSIAAVTSLNLGIQSLGSPAGMVTLPKTLHNAKWLWQHMSNFRTCFEDSSWTNSF